MSEHTAIITTHRTTYRLTPKAEAEAEEIYRRLNDPQDLEDGLLCVAHDNVIAGIRARLEQHSNEMLLKAILG